MAPRTRVDVDVGELGRVAGEPRAGSPVSSIVSRTAASHGGSPGSTWPPGWTQIPSVLWRCSTIPRGRR